MSEQTLPKLNVYDTLQAGKRPFETIIPGLVQMYVCGLTVYDYAHVGHARTFIVFDMIQRYLQHRGYRVKLIRNHTDIDDKIIRRAAEVGEDALELAETFIAALDDDIDRLGCLKPDFAPRVTQEIDTIVAFVQKLIDGGHAYSTDGNVFFEVSTFPEYGKLSKIILDDLRAGERVNVDERKRHPADFALWKAAKPGEPKWSSPWGDGRPGWHIECSAMSSTYLADTFDIHGGGRDLIFPHHENEIAQSEAANKTTFVNYWIHAGPLTIDGEKMSKSLGNFWTLRDLLEIHHPDVLRFFMLTSHYRKSVAFSQESLDEARNRVAYFYKSIDRLNRLIEISGEVDGDGPLLHEKLIHSFWSELYRAMDDDFNTPRLLAQLTELAKLANETMPRKMKAVKDPKLVRTLRRLRDDLVKAGDLVGLFTFPAEEALERIRALRVAQLGLDSTEIESLIDGRTNARTAKDWTLADQLRDKLADMGVTLMDTAAGTDWELN